MSAPPSIHLDLQQKDTIAGYLADTGWIPTPDEVVNIDKAGEGNMNLVLRVTTKTSSFIIKQSRAWVEKYPQIPAPEDRLLVEVSFYEAVQSLPDVAEKMPDLIAVDRPHRIAQFEDLGTASDFTYLYSDPSSAKEILPELCAWLSGLHAGSFDVGVRKKLQNKEMRTLNHEHIFHFPLVIENQFDLDAITPGLQSEGNRLKQNIRFVDTVTTLGQRYLNAGSGKRDVLLHGDYYPGSWLSTRGGLRIIDPEFGFFGDPEFDVGVFMAHMLLAGCEEKIVYDILELYEAPKSFVQTLAFQYAGVEIMRRLMGVAQLPLEADLETKAHHLQQAKHLVLAP